MIYEYFTKELELRETRYFPRSHSQPCGRVSLKRRYLCQSSVLVPILLSQFSSVAQSCPTLCDPWTTAHQASLYLNNSRRLLKLMSIESVMPSNHLLLCHPLLLPPSIFPSIKVFPKKPALRVRWLECDISFLEPVLKHPH